MTQGSFDLGQVTHVTAGAVGPPGKRTFYLQLRQARKLVSLAIEKQQLRLLAERLEESLPGDTVPELGPGESMGLEEPIAAAWRVGTITLAYDEAARRVDVSLLELVEQGKEGATGHFVATVDQMQALARHAASVVAAGRPPCPVCGGPIDHDGRICPRLNGHNA